VVVGRSWAPNCGAPTGQGHSCRRLYRRRWLHRFVDGARAKGARPLAGRVACRGGDLRGRPEWTQRRVPARYWAALADLLPLLGQERACTARAAGRIVSAVRTFCESRGEDVWLRGSGTMMVSAAPARDDAIDRAVAPQPVDAPKSGAARRHWSQSESVRRSSVTGSISLTARRQPARLVHALRRAAMDAGVTYGTRLRCAFATDIATPRGTVRAGDRRRGNAAATGGGLWRAT
jgi:hypothetical protein